MQNINKFLMFNSPLYSVQFDDGEEHLPPLGEGYIVTQLNNCGVSAELIDCVYERLGVKQIIEIINQDDAAHIGFNIFSVNIDIVRDILQGIKRDVCVYLGGKAIMPLWPLIKKWKLHFPVIAVIGEAELILPELVLGTCREAPVSVEENCMLYRVGRNSYYYPDHLDELPLDRGLFQNREIVNKYGRTEGCMIASRGCIYNCAFCGGARSADPDTTPRVRSIQSLSAEIEGMVKDCPLLQSIRLLDDLFLRDRNSITDACTLFYQYPRLKWRCMAHVHSFINNTDLIPEMQHAGCEEVFIGIESGADKIRKKINKVGSVAEIKSVIRELLRNGIHVKGYFICGFPQETEEEMLATAELARQLKEISNGMPGNFRATAFQFRPYHGTQLYNELFSGEDVCCYYHTGKLSGKREQYGFSAGNFSAVSDIILEKYMKEINSVE